MLPLGYSREFFFCTLSHIAFFFYSLLCFPFVTKKNFKHIQKQAKYRVGQKQVYHYEYIKQFIVVLLLMNYCIVFHMNNCKPTLVSPYITCNYFLKPTDKFLNKGNLKSLKQINLCVPPVGFCVLALVRQSLCSQRANNLVGRNRT